MTVENSEQSYERILGGKNYGSENLSHNSNAVSAEYPHQTPNSVSPERTIGFPSACEVQIQSCIPIGSRHQFEGTGTQAISTALARDKTPTPACLALNQQVGVCAPHISKGYIEGNGIAQRPWAPNSDHCSLVESARGKSTAPPKGLQGGPISDAASPSKRSHTPPVDFVQHTSLETPECKQIRLDRGFLSFVSVNQM
jgi:hypothetical protein